MIVMNDKILDARSVQPTLIQMMVLGDDGPSRCEGRSTYGRPSHRGSPDDRHRQFTSLPMNGQSMFPRQAQDHYNIHNHGKGLGDDDSSKHSREGNKYSDEAAMKNNKRKLDHSEGSGINSPKLPRTCHNSNSRLESGLVRVPLGTERQDRKEAPLLRCEDHRRMEEIERVACDGNRLYKTSRRDERFVGNVTSVPQENATKYKNDGNVEWKWNCSSNDRRLVQASVTGYEEVSIHKNPMKFQDHLEDGEKSPTAFPINYYYNPSNGNWKDTNRLFIGQEGQKMDILKGPLPSSFAGQESRNSKLESKGSSGVLNHSDCNESPGQKEANVTDTLCKVSSTFVDSQKFSLSSQHNFHLPSPKPNNGDTSKNNSNPLPSYNGSGVLDATWHPFYSSSSAVSGGISAPTLASHGTMGTGSSTYSHLNVHFPHYFSAKLLSRHESPLSSLLTISPQLDSTYGESLRPLTSTYNCYHPKHLQACSQARRTAAYGQLNLCPVVWQNGNVNIHSGPRLPVSRQDYVNGERMFNMGLLNPWSFHQSQNNIDECQPALGQFSSESDGKELLASSSLQASSVHFYKEDVNGTELCEDFSQPFPHSLRKVKAQNAPSSKTQFEPAPNVQLYKELAFKRDLGSHDQIESQINTKDNANMLAEVRDMKPLALAFRNEQNTKCREPTSISPNPRPTSSSKESSSSALDLTSFKHSLNFASKTGTDTNPFTNNEVKRGLTSEATSLYSTVDRTILQQHPPFHKQPREGGQRMKDQNSQYNAPLSSLHTLGSKDSFGDLTSGHLEEKYGLAKDLALPVSLATPMEVHHPRELPLIMPTSKSAALTKTWALVPKEIMKIDCNGRLESEKTRDLRSFVGNASVYNQMPPTPCPSASEKQITVVPQMELCEKINKGTYSRIDLIDSIHQESNTNCNPFHKEHLSNSPTSKPSNEDLGQYNDSLSLLNGTLNTKRFTQVTHATDYYTPKKYKAARAVSPCPKKLSSECPPCAGEMRTDNVRRDTSSPKVLMPNVSQVNRLSCQDAFNAGPSLQLNPYSCHTKLKKAWLTRHSEQDSTREQQGSSHKETASAQIVSKGIATEPAAVLNNSKQQEESVERLAAKRRYEHWCDGEHSDVADNRHWLRTRREGKSGQVLEEKEVKSSSKEEEELRGTRVLNRKLEKENGHVQNDQSGAPRPKDSPRVMLLKNAGESFLQDVPCTELFTNVPRCRDCWPSRSRKGQELPPLSSVCRFMHLRRLSITRNGGLKVEGFSTEDQVNEEVVLEKSTSPRETGLEADTSAYILAHVGDLFCDLVLAEQRLLERIAGESSDGAIACKASTGEKEERCDSCHSVVFNIHWVCPRCGFFVCMDCYDMKQKKERGEEGTAWLKCVKGHSHDIKNLRPTQLVANSALVALCEKMHSSKRRLGIKSNCTCVNGEKKWLNKMPATSKSPKLQTDAKVELSHSLTPGEEPAKSRSTAQLSQESNSNHASSYSHSPLHWLAELATRKAEEETNEVDVAHSRPGITSASRSAAYHGSRNAEQCSTLCDLLTTTAGKLRLGCTDAGMAFAPVYTALNNCDIAARSMPSILDEIIASVVERKIPITKSPKQSKEDQSQRKELDPDAKETEEHRVSIHYSKFSKGIFPWIQNHINKNNWKLFQEHWIKGVPVLVPGVLTATDSNFWGPERLRQELGEESVNLVNCSGHSVLTRARSKEFWEGFKTHSKCPRIKARGSKMLRLDYCATEKQFSERMPAQFKELHRHLPLPEYTRNDGKLNLISRLSEERAKSQLELRVCSVYGLSLDDGNTGSSSMCVELTDTLHILVHAEPPQEDRDTVEKAIMGRLEGDMVDDAVIRRLRETSERPGALWHIYTAQDTETINDFLKKVVEHPAGQDCYLDHALRRRLLEECGVGSRAVLQFWGDALMIPVATMYQVQYLTNCIMATKAFISPENVKYCFQSTALPKTSNSGTKQNVQMKTILFDTVKDCVEMLRPTSPS
ncbi:probable JmjC domain-containing histone demethylation protein 2C [Heptranchias perlo]|uniref:probable JmjC domain-containing histone demethylation protein 2C n=1 Tax=Heptranchias perlo TaxID=212740 RepID=UPI00355A973B